MKKFVAFLAVFGLILVAIIAVKRQTGESIDVVKEKLVSVPEDLKTAVSS